MDVERLRRGRLEADSTVGTSVALLHVGHASVCRMCFHRSDKRHVVVSTSSFLVILLFD